MTIAAPQGYITHTFTVSLSHAHTLWYTFLLWHICKHIVHTLLSLFLSLSRLQTAPRQENVVLFKGSHKLVSHCGRSKLHPQINTLMGFHTFITRLTLQSFTLQGEGSHVSGRRLPVHMLLNIIEVEQEISVADRLSSLRKRGGSKWDTLNAINATDCSLCTGNLKTEGNYHNLQGGLCKAEYGWIDFQKPVPSKKKQADCKSCGNDRYASIAFIYRVGVEHYC